jgi:hypothetical protein
MKSKLCGVASAMSLAAVVSCCLSANASIINPSDMILVATVDTLGAYDNRGIDYYNGNPISPTNYPSAYQDILSAQWDFYVSPSAKNNLFIVADQIVDTHFGYVYGEPFYLIPLTGFEFLLPVKRNHSDPIFSNQYAVSNEFLANGGQNGSNLPIDTTPGWSVTSISGDPRKLDYTITTPDENYSFTHFNSVYGATRILGGGVFELTYSPKINLLRQADFKELVASASNGEGAYTEQGTLVYAYSRRQANTVPETSTLAMLLLGFAGLGFVGYRRSKNGLAL